MSIDWVVLTTITQLKLFENIKESYCNFICIIMYYHVLSCIIVDVIIILFEIILDTFNLII